MAQWFLAASVAAFGMATTLVIPGFLLEGPQAGLERSDAIIIISGDESLGRFGEGLRLYRGGWAATLIFSGAAREPAPSNAEVMRRMAIAEGVPPGAIVTDDTAEDTYGNAVHTRDLMLRSGLRSAILVTSPYHLRRAAMTFEGVYRDTDIRLIARAAPDGDWRKSTWWVRHDTRALTVRELEKLGYVGLTGRYN